jgi:hypothetical protein
MAIGMCRSCDEWFDESEYDWDVEMCLAHAEEHYEEEAEEEEYNSDSKFEEVQLELDLIEGWGEMQKEERLNGKILNFARNYGMSQAELSKIVMGDD